MVGTPSPSPFSTVRAIASACPRSSAPRPGIRARRVDRGDDRQAETVGEIHQPNRLAIALGTCHPEIPLDPGIRVAALLLSDELRGPSPEPHKPADDRKILRERTVARQRQELLEQDAGEIRRMRTPGVARDLATLSTASASRRSRQAALRRASPVAGFPARSPGLPRPAPWTGVRRSAPRARQAPFQMGETRSRQGDQAARMAAEFSPSGERSLPPGGRKRGRPACRPARWPPRRARPPPAWRRVSAARAGRLPRTE